MREVLGRLQMSYQTLTPPSPHLPVKAMGGGEFQTKKVGRKKGH